MIWVFCPCQWWVSKKRSLDGGWVGGVSSIQFFLDFWNFLTLQSPLVRAQLSVFCVYWEYVFVQHLNNRCSPTGKSHLERAALLCLKLVVTTLEKQEAFLNALRTSGTATMVSEMDKLLLAINPRSNKPSHLVNIARYEWNIVIWFHTSYSWIIILQNIQ